MHVKLRNPFLMLLDESGARLFPVQTPEEEHGVVSVDAPIRVRGQRVGAVRVVKPTIAMRNVYVLPGVPEIFRRKFDAMRERFRDAPIHLKNVFVRIGEGTLADYLNRLLGAFPLLLIGSYPELSNPEYQVKVTLESRDRAYLEQALTEFLDELPQHAVVKVT